MHAYSHTEFVTSTLPTDASSQQTPRSKGARCVYTNPVCDVFDLGPLIQY